MPSQASDVDQFLDDLFNPVLDQLSDARSLAASIKGGDSDFEQLLSRPDVLANRIKGGGKGVSGVGSHQVRFKLSVLVLSFFSFFSFHNDRELNDILLTISDEHSESIVSAIQFYAYGKLATVDDSRIDVTAVFVNAFGAFV